MGEKIKDEHNLQLGERGKGFHVGNKNFNNMTVLSFHVMLKDMYFLVHVIERKPVSIRLYTKMKVFFQVTGSNIEELGNAKIKVEWTIHLESR